MVFKRRNIPWNKGTKGVMKSWNKGKKCPQISKALRGTKRPDLVTRNKARTKDKIKIVCPCGNIFFVIPSRVKYGVKYCSKECYNRFTSHARAKGKHWKLSKETKIKQGLRQIGEKNHQWNGGYFRGKYIGIPQSKEFALSVFKRDHYLCQICGDTGRKAKLNAHHLNSVDKFPKEAGEISNGITLCQKHHREFHNKYGYGNNTKKQFEEFTTEKIEKVEKINLKKSVIYNISLEGDSPFYANGILTHNTPPHIIKPKNKKALKFEVGRIERLSGKGGKKNIVFAKEVRHPGTRPNPFIRNTLLNKLKGIIIDELIKA